jgi:hypothetical protein
MRMLLKLVAPLATAGLASQVIAAPDTVTYQLQERCGHAAEEWFKRSFREVENTKDGQAFHSFRNHYNSKLNKCIVLTYMTSYKSKPKSMIVFEQLMDLNENNELGSFAEMGNHVFMSCALGDKMCSSRAEWEQLIKPYLED